MPYVICEFLKSESVNAFVLCVITYYVITFDTNTCYKFVCSTQALLVL